MLSDEKKLLGDPSIEERIVRDAHGKPFLCIKSGTVKCCIPIQESYV